MIRIKDPKASQHFYQDVLGMTLLNVQRTTALYTLLPARYLCKVCGWRLAIHKKAAKQLQRSSYSFTDYRFVLFAFCPSLGPT